MPVNFDLHTITPHQDYDTITEAQADLVKIEYQIAFCKQVDPQNQEFITWLQLEHDLCMAYIVRGNGRIENGVPYQSFETIDKIEREDVDFLWTNRIPRAKLTDFSGDPGIGKSTVASMIAATISKGVALPFDIEPEAPLRTLIISSEDTPADVLRPRLERMNADMSMIAIPNRAYNTSDINATLIDKVLTDFPAALCIIDPVIAYIHANTSRANEVRDFLTPIDEIAKKHKAAIILIRHLNKSKDSSALYRGQGSIDFAGICRSLFVFAKDSDNSARRFMSHAKCSVAMAQPTLEYFIDQDGMFKWGLETAESADEILVQKGHEPKEKKAAVEFLKKLLELGPMPSNEIKDRAAKAGVSWGTIWRAKAILEIKASKERETGAWFWRLP